MELFTSRNLNAAIVIALSGFSLITQAQDHGAGNLRDLAYAVGITLQDQFFKFYREDSPEVKRSAIKLVYCYYYGNNLNGEMTLTDDGKLNVTYNKTKTIVKEEMSYGGSILRGDTKTVSSKNLGSYDVKVLQQTPSSMVYITAEDQRFDYFTIATDLSHPFSSFTSGWKTGEPSDANQAYTSFLTIDRFGYETLGIKGTIDGIRCHDLTRKFRDPTLIERLNAPRK